MHHQYQYEYLVSLWLWLGATYRYPICIYILLKWTGGLPPSARSAMHAWIHPHGGAQRRLWGPADRSSRVASRPDQHRQACRKLAHRCVSFCGRPMIQQVWICDEIWPESSIQFESFITVLEPAYLYKELTFTSFICIFHTSSPPREWFFYFSMYFL